MFCVYVLNANISKLLFIARLQLEQNAAPTAFLSRENYLMNVRGAPVAAAIRLFLFGRHFYFIACEFLIPYGCILVA